jgi:hydrogenase expression/formation protein HypC
MCLSEPARILALTEDRSEATGWWRGAERTISLAPLTLDGRDVAVGDWVLVSSGLAIEHLDEKDAMELLSLAEEVSDAGRGSTG